MKKAIFLDRDGTLNYDSGYTHRCEDLRILPGVIAGLRMLKKAGYLLIVASNQSGIARGIYGEDELRQFEACMQAEFARNGCPVDSWRCCPHAPDAGCACRKPEPGMLLSTANELSIDLGASWMLGDKVSDLEAGFRAGARAGLIFNPELPYEERKARELYPMAPVWHNLEAAAQAIIAASA